MAPKLNTPFDFVAALLDRPAAGFLAAAAGALRFCGVGLLGDLHVHHSAIAWAQTPSCSEGCCHLPNSSADWLPWLSA